MNYLGNTQKINDKNWGSIFLLYKAKNADDAKASARLFNAVEKEKTNSKWLIYSWVLPNIKNGLRNVILNPLTIYFESISIF